jgi:hypothetical protein
MSFINPNGLGGYTTITPGQSQGYRSGGSSLGLPGILNDNE